MQSYKCPNCGRIYNYGDLNNNVIINCLNCKYPLKKAEDVKSVNSPELNEHNVIGIIKNFDKNIPRCPTCNSTNVEKISTTKKIFGGAMFGLFSSDVRNMMHCNNCGYKW